MEIDENCGSGGGECRSIANSARVVTGSAHVTWIAVAAIVTRRFGAEMLVCLSAFWRAGAWQHEWLAGIAVCPQCWAMSWQHSRSAGVTPGRTQAIAGAATHSSTILTKTSARTRLTRIIIASYDPMFESQTSVTRVTPCRVGDTLGTTGTERLKTCPCGPATRPSKTGGERPQTPYLCPGLLPGA